MITFLSILGRYEAAEFSQLEAAELLGVGERTFRRWRQRFEDAGEAGFSTGGEAKASGKRVPADREAQVEALYRSRLHGQAFCRASGARSPFRLGLHLDQDVPAFAGFAGTGEAARGASAQAAAPADAWHDAALRRAQEVRGMSGFPGRRHGFRALAEVVGQHGLPLSLYTDRGSHYFYPPEAGG
jgi:hypothetical protein